MTEKQQALSFYLKCIQNQTDLHRKQVHGYKGERDGQRDKLGIWD